MSHDIWATIGPRLESNKSNIAWIRRNRDSESVSFTYGQIYEGALHMAGRLRQQGISQGDVVSLMGPNGPEWGIGALAVWRVGAVLAPVHIGNSEGDILKQLDALNPKLILTHDADSKVKDVNYPLMNLEIGSELAEQESQIPNNSLSSEESLRIYTSGSTGTPKVVRFIASKYFNELCCL